MPMRSQPRWRLHLAAVVALVMITAVLFGLSRLGSSGGAAHRSAASGTIVGVLSEVGGPAPGLGRAISGKVYAFGSAQLSGPAIATTAADSAGRFTLSVAPGRYYLAASSPSFQIDPAPPIPPCAGDRAADVRAGTVSSVQIYCSMK